MITSISAAGLVSPPHSPMFPPASKPLPEPGDEHSDLSSILPSHSASQIALVLPSGQSDLKTSDAGHPIPAPPQPYSLEIPPAHSISDHTIPTGTEVPHHPPADDSSSEDHGPLAVVENDRFTNTREPKKRKTKSKRPPEVGTIRMAEKPALPNGSPVTKHKTERDGNRKHGVLGTIAGLFTKSSPKKGWASRTDRNLRGDSDEDSIRYLAVSPSKREGHLPGSASERLKKRKKNRASTLDHPAFETHDWPVAAGKGKTRATSLDHHQGELSATEDHLSSPRVITRRRSSSQPHLPLPTHATPLSRNNSLTTSVASITSAPTVPNPGRSPVSSHRRRSATGAHPPTKTSSHRRTASGTSDSVNPVQPQTNLMSIVEEAVRVNREARISMNPNNRLESIKAPPSVSEVLKHEAEAKQANTEPPPLPQASPPKPTRPKSLPRSPENTVAKQTPQTQHNRDTSLPAATSTPATKQTSLPVDKPLPVRSPLKSALRNPSRTPSPNPSTLRPTVSSPPPSQLVNRISEISEDDSASISSYETGHENFDSRPNSPPAPPRDLVVNAGVDSDLSHGTSSTAIASTDNGTPSRRKSVRMSLPPTYSKTPPVREDWEVEKPPRPPPRDNAREEANRTPRNERVDERDLWEDSSSEDEEYSTARRLLNKLTGRH